MGTAVGIDLGTTNTVMAVVDDGLPRIVPLSPVDGLLPSVVSVAEDGQVIVGHEARTRRAIDPESTIFSTKRILGRPWGHELVSRASQRVAFRLAEGPRQSVSVEVRGTAYGLPEISAFVVRKAREEAEKVLGDRVEKVVVTVPANFNDLQRGATKIACELAGVEVLRILNEPTAAALAYGLALGTQERMAVFDLGGGTFDLTILDLASNVFEVVATAGDSMLGGDDIDRAIALRMASECSKAFRFDPRGDTATFSRLLLAAEQVKRSLTTELETRIEIPGLEREPGAPPLTLGFSLSRSQLEQLAQPLLDRAIRVCERALATAQLTAKNIDRVVLVGGSTRSPFVAQRVAAFFEREPYCSLDPDRVVALGAALQASALDRGRTRRPASSKIGLRPITKVPSDRSPSAAPSSSSGDSMQRSLFATGQTPPSPEARPAAPSLDLAFGDLDLPTALPPPELPSPVLLRTPPPPPLGLPSAGGGTFGSRVPTLSGLPAMSAETLALLQGVDERLRIQGKLPLLVDVTPLGLAIETAGGYAQFLVAANTPIPCDRTMRFATAADNQTAVAVRVAQGDAPRFDGNTPLGELTLSGLRPAMRGVVQVEVTFAIDASGILNVSAKDVETGIETSAQMRLLGTRDDQADLVEMAARHERALEARAP